MKSVAKRVSLAWSSSIELCKKNFLVVLLIALVDIAFFFVLGFATSYFVDQILEKAYVLTQSLSAQLQVDSATGLLSILFLPSIQSQTVSILGLMLLTLAITYVCYTLIQGVAWHLASSFVRQRAWPVFMKGFSRVNLVWFALFALFFVTLTLVDLRYTIVASLAGSDKPILPFVPIYVFLLAIIYGAFVSYSPLNLKETIHLMKQPFTLVLFASIIGVLAVFNLVTYATGIVAPTISMIISLVALPLITIIRLVILKGLSTSTGSES